MDQDPAVSFAFAHFLSGLPYPVLLALTELAGACKSLLIAFALHDGFLTVEQVRFASPSCRGASESRAVLEQLRMYRAAGGCMCASRAALAELNSNDEGDRCVQAVKAARIEEDVQMEIFGLVEGGHDVDIADLRTRVSGCALYLSIMAHGQQASAEDAAVRRDVSKAMGALSNLGF